MDISHIICACCASNQAPAHTLARFVMDWLTCTCCGTKLQYSVSIYSSGVVKKEERHLPESGCPWTLASCDGGRASLEGKDPTLARALRTYMAEVL